MKDCVARIEANLDYKLAPDWPNQYRDESYAALHNEIEAMPGAKEAITLIGKAKRKMCIASSGPMEKMQITLGQTGLMRHFDGLIYNSDMVDRGKPAPDLFLHAAKDMGVAPEATIVIEDSPVGARAARAAGMTCLGYVGGALRDDVGLAAEGAHLIDDLRAVVDYI